MEFPELQGLTGNGIRKAMQGRRTDTTACVEVLLGNVSDVYYNNIHGTSVVNGHTLLQNQTNCSITLQCPSAPVVSERLQVISGINILNDPLVQVDGGGNFLQDPNDWSGAGKRIIEYTGLSDREYTVYVSTDLVASHGNGACKQVAINIRPKRQSGVTFINVGCADDSMDSDASDPNGLTSVPRQAALDIVASDPDYVVSGDDFPYCTNAARSDHWWHLPRSSTTSSADPTTDFSGASMAQGMIDNNINTLDALTDINQALAMWENLTAQMNPFYVYLGYHCVVTASDTGDHGVRRFNGTQYGPWAGDRSGFQALLSFDFGLANDNTDPRPANSDTVAWIHDGSDGGNGGAIDPYDQSGSPTRQTNILTAFAEMESYREWTLSMLDYFMYNKWEHNVASATPDTPIMPAALGAMPSLASANDLTLPVGSGGLGVTDNYFYKPRWKYMDFGTTCRIYSIETSAFNYGNHTLEDNRDGILSVVTDTVDSVIGSDQLADLTAHMQAADSAFDFFVIVCGDVLYPTNAIGTQDADGDVTASNTDGIWFKAPTENSSLKALLEGLDCPVALLTSDNHSLGITHWNSNVIECHGAISSQGAMRGLAIPESHLYNHSEASKTAGYDRVIVDAAQGSGKAVAIASTEARVAVGTQHVSDEFTLANGVISYASYNESHTVNRMGRKTLQSCLSFGGYGGPQDSIYLGMGLAHSNVVYGDGMAAGWPLVLDNTLTGSEILAIEGLWCLSAGGTGVETPNLNVNAARSSSVADNTTLEDPFPATLTMTSDYDVNASIVIGPDATDFSSKTQASTPSTDTVNFLVDTPASPFWSAITPFKLQGRGDFDASGNTITGNPANPYGDLDTLVAANNRIISFVNTGSKLAAGIHVVSSVSGDVISVDSVASTVTSEGFIVVDNYYAGTVTLTQASVLVDTSRSTTGVDEWTDAAFSDVISGNFAVLNLTTGGINKFTDGNAHVTSADTLDLGSTVCVLQTGIRSGVADTGYQSGDIYVIVPLVKLVAEYTDPGASSGGGGSTRIIDHNIIG